jgi:hypothetical protein
LAPVALPVDPICASLAKPTPAQVVAFPEKNVARGSDADDAGVTTWACALVREKIQKEASVTSSTPDKANPTR